MYTVQNNHNPRHIDTDDVLLALTRTVDYVDNNPHAILHLENNEVQAVELAQQFDGPAYYKAYRALETLGLVKKHIVLRWATWANSHGFTPQEGDMTAGEYWENVMDKSMALDLYRSPQAKEYALTPGQCLRIIKEEAPGSVSEAMSGRLAGMFAFDNGVSIDF